MNALKRAEAALQNRVAEHRSCAAFAQAVNRTQTNSVTLLDVGGTHRHTVAVCVGAPFAMQSCILMRHTNTFLSVLCDTPFASEEGADGSATAMGC